MIPEEIAKLHAMILWRDEMNFVMWRMLGGAAAEEVYKKRLKEGDDQIRLGIK